MTYTYTITSVEHPAPGCTFLPGDTFRVPRDLQVGDLLCFDQGWPLLSDRFPYEVTSREGDGVSLRCTWRLYP